MSLSTENFPRNWMPYKLHMDQQEPYCQWLNMNTYPISEPFFADTINVRREAKFFKCVSSLTMLEEWQHDIDPVLPAAFIFHVSRCGSTLLSQLLSTDERNIVLSEVPFFDELLRLHLKSDNYSTGQADVYLKQAITFYAQKRRGVEEQLFIKADCWHIFFYERLRKLYPTVPFFLLYRSPDEVFQSQQKQKGMQAVPGVVEPEIMGLTLAEGDPAIFDHGLYFSRVLEKIMTKFIEVKKKDGNSYLLNYKEGSPNWITKIEDQCKVSFNDSILDAMNERSRYHGKYPGELFQKEIFRKVPDYLSKCFSLYSTLEEIRLSNSLPILK